MALKRFRPRFIMATELSAFGLPDESQVKNIMQLVDTASVMIDEYCGRTDGHGNGSLVYTSYQERLLLQARNRNILRVTFKPMVTVTPSVANELAASGDSVGSKLGRNFYSTGVLGNTIARPDGTVTPILECGGRYGYARRSEMSMLPDQNFGMSLMQVAAYFGGPPGFTAMDVTAIDFDEATGEIWIPAGLYMGAYTELVIKYNSGFDPREMPDAIKQACAAITKNALSKGAGTTGLRNISSPGAVSVAMADELIDTNVQGMLEKYKNIIAY